MGAGPAGSATALGIAARDPALARDTLVLEKSHHPRDKTCAGGVIPKGLRLLEELGVPFDVPRVRVDRARVETPVGAVEIEDGDLCHVVRRRELDARLVATVRARGVEVEEDAVVRALERDGDGVRVTTDRGTHWARAVVGADGSGSLVRRALVPGDGGVVARAIMTDVPVGATAWSGHAQRRYDFDFRSCADGLRGYRWVFPNLVDGVPHANVGAYALPPIDGIRLRAELSSALGVIGAADQAWKAFPIRVLTPRSAVAAPRALLVGDAAGVEALLGEGISFALEYGILAAEAIVAARATGDWSFTGYAASVHAGAIGRKLRRLWMGARLFYGRASRPMFRITFASVRAQRIGLRWYNGVSGFEGRGAWGAIRLLMSRRPLEPVSS